MECVLGIACNDFVILASDMTNAHSILVNKQGNYLLFIKKIEFLFFRAIATALMIVLTFESYSTNCFVSLEML